MHIVAPVWVILLILAVIFIAAAFGNKTAQKEADYQAEQLKEGCLSSAAIMLGGPICLVILLYLGYNGLIEGLHILNDGDPFFRTMAVIIIAIQFLEYMGRNSSYKKGEDHFNVGLLFEFSLPALLFIVYAYNLDIAAINYLFLLLGLYLEKRIRVMLHG